MAQELVTLAAVAQGPDGCWVVLAADGGTELLSLGSEEAAVEAADLVSARLAAERGLALEAVRFRHPDTLRELQAEDLQALVALPWDTFLGNLQAGIPAELQDTQPLEDGWAPEGPHASSQPNEPQESAAAAPSAAAGTAAAAEAATAEAVAGAAMAAMKTEGEAGAGGGGKASGAAAARSASNNPWRLLEGGGACKVLAKSDLQQCILTGGLGGRQGAGACVGVVGGGMAWRRALGKPLPWRRPHRRSRRRCPCRGGVARGVQRHPAAGQHPAAPRRQRGVPAGLCASRRQPPAPGPRLGGAAQWPGPAGRRHAGAAPRRR